MEEHEARGCWSEKGGDMGGRELIYTFEVPEQSFSIIR